jgi:8-oxo-dGTP diphosphatase
MKKYTLCFLFDETLSYVLLVKKTKPDWQAGKLNAIGGKVEDGETFAECACREFREETGLNVRFTEQNLFAVIADERIEMHCFSQTTSLEHLMQFETTTDEQILMLFINEQTGWPPCVHNLPWLTQMALMSIGRAGVYRICHERPMAVREAEGVG